MRPESGSACFVQAKTEEMKALLPYTPLFRIGTSFSLRHNLQRDTVSFMTNGQPIPILLFADSILGIRPYNWQCNILLNYEEGNQTAAACANFTGKTSTVFPIAALWTLYNFPRARLMYILREPIGRMKVNCEPVHRTSADHHSQ